MTATMMKEGTKKRESEYDKEGDSQKKNTRRGP